MARILYSVLSMSLSLRFILPLFVALATLTVLSMQLTDRAVQRWAIHDLDSRADLVTHVIAADVESAARNADAKAGRTQLQNFLDRAATFERIRALGFCDDRGNLVAASRFFPADFSCRTTHPVGAKLPEYFVTQREMPGAHGSLEAPTLSGMGPSGPTFHHLDSRTPVI